MLNQWGMHSREWWKPEPGELGAWVVLPLEGAPYRFYTMDCGLLDVTVERADKHGKRWDVLVQQKGGCIDSQYHERFSGSLRNAKFLAESIAADVLWETSCTLDDVLSEEPSLP